MEKENLNLQNGDFNDKNNSKIKPEANSEVEKTDYNSIESQIDNVGIKTAEELNDSLETKKIEKIYYANIMRRNPNHGGTWYIKIIGATYDVAFPKEYAWDYDYNVYLLITVERLSDNRLKLTCKDKEIVVGLSYFERRPESIGENIINKILNIVGYEIDNAREIQRYF